MDKIFAAPSMMWWAAAASVPIIIHLLSRRRFKRVPWAAMEFLNRAFKRTRRRLRVENLLLLLLRIAILVLLAIALADPRVRNAGLFGDIAGSSRNVFFVVDTSFSMDARDSGDRSPFIRAKSLALEVARSLDGESDASSLVTSGTPAHLVVPLTHELDRVSNAIDSLDATHASTDTVGALKVVSSLLQEPGLERDFPGRKIVYFFTDLQRGPFETRGAENEEGDRELGGGVNPAIEGILRDIREAGGELVFVDVAAGDEERPANVAVTELGHVGKTLVRGIKTRFECRVRNFGDLTIDSADLEFYVDQEARFDQRERVIALKGLTTGTSAETEVSFTFEAEFKEPGWHYVAARFVDDALKVDNVRRYAFNVRDRLRVLAVNGTNSREPEDAATFFVARALDPFLGHGTRQATSFEVREISVLDAQGEDFASYDMVVLADVAQLSPNKVRELETFVEGGGSLLYFAGKSLESGDRIGPDGGSTNAQFYRGGAGLLPGRLLETIGSDEFTEVPYGLQFDDLEHPAMAYFADPKIQPGITRIPVYKFVSVEVDEDPAVHVLASFRRSDSAENIRTWPAIIEKKYGQGLVTLITTSADKSWNFYGPFSAFVPLMKEIAYHSTRRVARSNVLVGESLVERFAPTVEEVVIERGDTPAVHRKTSLAPDKTATEIVLPRLETAEVIRIRPATESEVTASAVRFVAVNVDAAESDLARADRAWMTANFGTELMQVVEDLDELVQTTDEMGDSGLWKVFLYAVLIFLGLETVFAQRFGRSQVA